MAAALRFARMRLLARSRVSVAIRRLLRHEQRRALHASARRCLDDAGDRIEIGAGATYAAATAAVAGLYPDAGELVRRIGSVQITNAGPVGGNVANCSPIGDMPPFLIAAGASLVLRRGAERRSMPLEDFFVAYGRQDRRPGRRRR